MENKPREFWIDEGVNGFDLGWYKRDVAEFPNKGTCEGRTIIHVIEKSYADKLLEVIKIMRDGLILIKDKAPFCDCMDAPSIANEAIAKADEVMGK